MKSRKRLLLSVFVMVILSLLLAIPTFAKPKLNKKNVTLQVGQSVKLRVTGRGKQKVKWRSSDEDVAFVDSGGTVETFGVGTAIIRAKVGKTTLKCKVTVKSAPTPTPVPTPTPPTPAITIDTQSVPFHISTLGATIHHEIDIEKIDVQIAPTSNNRYNVTFVITAVKTSEVMSFFESIHWKIYNSDNILLGGAAFKAYNVGVGDRFVASSSFTGAPAGHYRLEIISD